MITRNTFPSSGLIGYVGAPGHGKTHLGFQHLKALCAHDGKPALVIESIAGESHFAKIEKAKTVDEVVARVWRDGKHTAFTPREPEEVEAICRAIQGGRDVHLFIDESAFWMTSKRGTQSDLTRLFRSYRHSRSTIQFTTQHFSGDIPQEVVSCNVELFIFKCMSYTTAERLEKIYGIPSQTVMSLPQFKFLHVKDGICLDIPKKPVADPQIRVRLDSSSEEKQHEEFEEDEHDQETGRSNGGSPGG